MQGDGLTTRTLRLAGYRTKYRTAQRSGLAPTSNPGSQSVKACWAAMRVWPPWCTVPTAGCCGSGLRLADCCTPLDDARCRLQQAVERHGQQMASSRIGRLTGLCEWSEMQGLLAMLSGRPTTGPTSSFYGPPCQPPPHLDISMLVATCKYSVLSATRLQSGCPCEIATRDGLAITAPLARPNNSVRDPAWRRPNHGCSPAKRGGK